MMWIYLTCTCPANGKDLTTSLGKQTNKGKENKGIKQHPHQTGTQDTKTHMPYPRKPPTSKIERSGENIWKMGEGGAEGIREGNPAAIE